MKEKTVTIPFERFERLEQLAAVLESIKESVIITDLRRRIIYTNPGAERMLGYSREELVGRTSNRIFEGIPGNPPRLADFVEEKADAAGWEGEIFNRRKDGRIFPVALTVSPVLDREGAVVGYVGISHDITRLKEYQAARRRETERIEAEVIRRTEELAGATEKLAAQQARLDAILSGVAEGVVVINSDYVIEFTNRMLVEWYGERTGQKCHQAFFGRKTPCPVCGVKEVIEGGKDFFRFETTDRRKRYYEVVATPLVEPSGRRRIIEISRDITARKKTESLVREKNLQLTEINQELKRLLRVKSEFLSLISHELKSPLTVIKGYLKLLSDKQLGALDPDQEEGLRAALTETEHLEYLINQFLDIAQLETGKYELVKKEFDARPVIRDCIRTVKESIPSEKIRFRIAVGKDAGIINADKNKIRQVFRNLLENSVKFSPEGGTITVRGERREDSALFVVEDQGVGLAPRDQVKVFERFYQVSSPLTVKHGGLGLGLSIVKNIINLHDGEIWLESGPGKGTRACFTIPV